MNEPFPIIIHSNAPWNGTGYGQQTAQVAERLRDAGHDVAISCMTGLNGQPTTWHGIACLPVGIMAYGTDVVGPHARQFLKHRPGLLLTLYDVWCIDPEAITGLAVASWAPVHSSKMSVGDQAYFSRSAALPIAMSRHGEQAMTAAGLQPLYIPHGIDTETFRPLDEAERAEARRILSVPQDCFLVAMVAANKGVNPPRKAWSETFTAFAEFRKHVPEAVLFVHSMINGGGLGINLGPLIMELGIGDAVHFSDQYAQVAGLFTPSYVAGLLGAADVLVNASYGEGFGLAAVEAQACGTPVILGRNSAQVELCGSGWLVDCQPWWHNDDQAYWYPPRVESITERLLEAWHHARDPQMRQAAREFAEGYDADLVFAEHWKPALDMLAEYCGAAKVTLPSKSRPQLPTAEADGLTWIQRGAHTDDWIATGHEEFLAPYLDELLPDGGVFLDVGAHVGRWALRLARKASRVWAVEANPDTAAVFRAHLALNPDVAGKVRLLEMAAWDSETRLTLDEPEGRIDSGSTRVTEEVPPLDDRMRWAVEAKPLDDALAGVLSLDLVKIDVEGADLHVLRGMAKILAECRPALLIERHDIYGYYRLTELEELLASYGYGWREVNIPLQDGAVAAYLACKPLAAGETPPEPRPDPAMTALSAVSRFGASQYESELRDVLQLMVDQPARPQVIVELGCDRGGTLYVWRQVAEHVFGITTGDNEFASGGSGKPLKDHGAQVLFGDSHDPASLVWLRGQLRRRRVDVLVLDGDHTPAGIAADLAAYGPLVRPGGLILLHDIHTGDNPLHRGWERAHVRDVWPALTETYKTTEIGQPGGYGWGIIHVGKRDTFGRELGDGSQGQG